MAEQKGFFRRIFSFGAKEEDRTSEESGLPRVNDATGQRPDATAAEMHQPAAASTETDAEAGASAAEPAGGGITPLTPRDRDAPSVEAEKKTLK
ncbi:hypothetical protein [Aureimonas sp. AU12]|uniref:hypothetical protein n=1 Tax=Aureimonas sp. AU12 TaxID=1638161 RepID=UPI000782A0DA|nr:hypothetical protein [Aureimonas sp. AU12]